ncbi:MAG TPA: hypothetical protein VK730_01860 [Solirubrobacteraceae bacterium]|jgi:pimeloyl-ACP methyl ester carboxylesterase|nr:hypothetical protein [Solirubrobacteraceae bacterium]
MTTDVKDPVVWYEKAKKIKSAERDSALGLTSPAWPPSDPPPGWEIEMLPAGPGEIETGYMWRTIVNRPDEDEVPSADGDEVPSADAATPTEEGRVAIPLRESVLRFPSAPIRGVQRLHDYHSNPPPSETMHTYRILTASPRPSRISRIFLFHNGLNELDRMGLYYRLASQIIASHAGDENADETGVACILRPFPGHLTRATFSRFAEEPLQRYLWDGSNLFCQFLRYMTETQWFLSALVRHSSYRSPSGAELLREKVVTAGSRLDASDLGTTMHNIWSELHLASDAVMKDLPKRRSQPPRSEGPEPGLNVFKDAITTLRSALSLQKWKELGGELLNHGRDEEPSLHVVGYSLGGFAAQSAFMSWPYVISSCSTLLSGGALRELSPTAFAHPEEWQTVLRSLRYELDEGMLNGSYRADANRIAGLDRELFHYFQRTFYEVFEQQYRGSYESRVETFRQRMLFVVGGNDAIVRPDSVLDSAPAGGMNLLEIGGLSHFIGTDARDTEEKRQRAFWLPEVGNLIGRFSADVAEQHAVERADTWLSADLEVEEKHGGEPVAMEESDRKMVRRLSNYERLELPGDGGLSSKHFAACLNDLLARQRASNGSGEKSEAGLLMVVRNEIPTVMLPARAVQRRARALCHDDEQTVKYCREIAARSRALVDDGKQTIMVLPWNAKEILEDLDASHRFPSQSETAVGQIAREITIPEIWDGFEKKLNEFGEDSVLIFDGREELIPRAGNPEVALKLINSLPATSDKVYVPSLPDCWLWVAPQFLELQDQGKLAIEGRELFIAAVNRYMNDKEGLTDQLQRDNVRVLTVSRARYNPRFRGKLVLNLGAVQQILLHVGLCVASAHKYPEFKLSNPEPGVAAERS